MTTLAYQPRTTIPSYIPSFLIDCGAYQPIGLSRDMEIVLNRGLDLFNHYCVPITRPPIEQIFNCLSKVWYEETALSSSITDIVNHPAYQKIISFGPDILPYIFRELERQSSHWFWALKSITGANPIKPEQRGKVKEMADSWLKWGKDNGYTW